MFDIGFFELLVIFILSIIIFGFFSDFDIKYDTPPDNPMQLSSRVESPLELFILFAVLPKKEKHEYGVNFLALPKGLK